MVKNTSCSQKHVPKMSSLVCPRSITIPQEPRNGNSYLAAEHNKLPRAMRTSRDHAPRPLTKPVLKLITLRDQIFLEVSHELCACCSKFFRQRTLRPGRQLHWPGLDVCYKRHPLLVRPAVVRKNFPAQRVNKRWAMAESVDRGREISL
ncbi:MAG: hypothetical protein H6Q52_121 [Deltaproteobacteria bacterium]|nr:hypothetical protein [Deltaproteobacteria bacterium]